MRWYSSGSPAGSNPPPLGHRPSTVRPPVGGTLARMGHRARSVMLHAAAGAVTGAVAAVAMLLMVALAGGRAAQPAAPFAEQLGAVLAGLDPGSVALLAGFGLASGLAVWAVGGPTGAG